MSQGNGSTGRWLGGLLMVLAALVIVPVVMLMIAWMAYFASRSQAQEARAQEARAIAEAQRAEIRAAESEPQQYLESTDESAAEYRPVLETQYREVHEEVLEPQVDETTGLTVLKPRQVVQHVPVTTTRLIRTRQSTQRTIVDPRVAQLVNELRNMSEGDDGREAKLNELRQRLELEFTAMHDKQAEEIERTAKRLESLKALHRQRGENRDKIIQRHIDELLGKADALRWNPVPAPELPARPTPTYQPRVGSSFEVPSPNPGWVPVVPAKPASNSAHVEIRPATPATVLNQTGAAAPARTVRRVERNEQIQASEQMQPQVNVSASAIGEGFQLARNSANAIVELAEAEAEYEQYKKLGNKGLIPSSELKKAELKLARLKREVELNRFQLEALQESLERELKLADAGLEHAEANLKLVDNKFRQGIGSNQELLQARYEAEKAKAAHQRAAASIRQLKTAMRLVQPPKDDQADRDKSGDDEGTYGEEDHPERDRDSYRDDARQGADDARPEFTDDYPRERADDLKESSDERPGDEDREDTATDFDSSDDNPFAR